MREFEIVKCAAPIHGLKEGQTNIKPEIVVSMLKLNIVKIQLEVDILLLQGRPRLPTTSKGNRLVI